MNKFIIVGTQRTGSSAFASYLSQHPKILCGWEWTQRAPWYKKINIARDALEGDFSVLDEKHRQYMTNALSFEVQWLGFRRLFRASDIWVFRPCYSPAVWIDRLEGHLRWISSDPDIYVIHIIRQDNVSWLKSKYMSKETKSYIGKEYEKGIKVRVPLGEAVASIKSKSWVDNRLATLTATNPYIQVIYENFLENPDAEIVRTLEFLHCDPLDMPAERIINKRQSTGVTSDYISNYNSLVLGLKEHGLLD